MYHLHSLRAAGVPRSIDEQHGIGQGLDRLTKSLDDITELGCGAVLVTPVFASSTHGYDTIDPFHIDPRLGDDAGFDRFVAACHARDLQLLLDGALNHVGRAFPRFADLVDHGEASPSATWFRVDFTRDDGDGFAYETFEGHRELVALNHRRDEVVSWAVDFARHWLERGIDGWRLDAAYAINRSFLDRVTKAIRSTYPEAFVFGEVIHGDYTRFVADSGCHSTTQYELHKAIWSSLHDRNLFELAWALRRHREMAEHFVPVTFVGNHDVTRIRSQLHEVDQLAPALTALLTLPGIPCVYYGDEHAWPGTKEHRAGGDDEIRPSLDAPPAADPDEAALAWRWHRTLVALRRAHPWLTDAIVDIGPITNDTIAYEVHERGGERHARVWLSASGAPSPPPDGGTSRAFEAPGAVVDMA